jgi:cardiolipin hydrolase
LKKRSKNAEVLFTRSVSVARVIERSIRASKISADVALYRLSNPRLARALRDAMLRGVQVRLILDRRKYEVTPVTKKLLAKLQLPFRLTSGRRGRYAKMHHKFAVLDGREVIAGSYNWTLESEEQNYENLIILRGPEQVKRFVSEFKALWSVPATRGKTEPHQRRR